jgi:hypothetical protein
MPVNVDKLLVLCSFYKQATLETDMAKRIMLSIIPSVMSDTEKFHSGGFDYKALKSAAAGAKDLIKYGAMACAAEMAYYGDKFNSDYENLSYKNLNNLTDETYEKFKKLKQQITTISSVKNTIKGLIQQGKYKECLQKCVEGFNDLEAWEYKYGGTAWAKIADTLVKMAEKREMLELIRQEAETKPNPKTDYLALEIETLREIIVLMNVFDGLAHNSGNVMPKLISEEYNETQKGNESNQEYDEDFPKTHTSAEQEIKNIQRLMDAKEFNDPFTVYKVVQKIIERPENKHLFGDWVQRIKSHPEFSKAKTMKQMQQQLGIIKVRKDLKAYMAGIDQNIDRMSAIKDKLLNVQPGGNKS